MRRRAAWRHWWAVIAVLGLGLVAVTANRAVPESDLWTLTPVALGLVVLATSMVVNRPRPSRQVWQPAGPDRDDIEAIRAVRRGAGVAPPDRQRQAVDAARREWFAVSLPCGVAVTLAVNASRRRDDPSQHLVDIVVGVSGYLLLLTAMIGTAYYGLILRRVDDVESRRGPDGEPAV